MPIRTLLPLTWFVAIALLVVLLGFAVMRNLRLSGGPDPAPLSTRWISGIAVAVLAIAFFGLAPATSKGQLALLGIISGGALGSLFAWAPVPWRDDPRRDLIARLAAGVILLGAYVFVLNESVMLSYAVLGLSLGLAGVALPLALIGHPRSEGVNGALAGISLAGAGLVWGLRTPAGEMAAIWVLLLAALSLTIGYAWTWGSRQLAVLLGPLSVGAIALPLGLWILRLEWPQVLPLILGLALATALGAILLLDERSEGAGPLPPLALVLLAGGGLLLANRLFGMYGVTVAGTGVTMLLLARMQAMPLMSLLLAVFAGRAWLQLFLERTYLRQFGVDLTHSYTAFGLLLAFLLPLVIVGLRRSFAMSGALLGIEALGLLFLPVIMGYFIHVDPMASYIAGLLAATFILGILELRPGVASLLPPLLISAIAVSLLAAPWLMSVYNAPRIERLAVFLALLIPVLGYLLALVRRPQGAAA